MIPTWRVTGLTPYERGHELQEVLVDRVSAGLLPGALLLMEHAEVLTIGRRRGARAHILDPSLPTIEVERGGDVTWHGPGQLVAYPILPTLDAAAHLRALEAAVIQLLTGLGLDARRDARNTGVWLGGPDQATLKVCSIGVAIRRWVSWHGLALNLDVELLRFHTIRPCGADPAWMTSLHRWLERPPSFDELAAPLTAHLANTLNAPLQAPIEMDLAALRSELGVDVPGPVSRS